ncbi:E3 ubiquitin-protein ligase RNF31-like isoform X2 [Protopterus annectens]|uniref:E3 ubiquitin-protein ligase RNF31-like isoform X2 n=1 Tax=Protopterus annectens TaxID=7888 RepID=UPI001CFB7452|nr:E3 ubiquitin-protein ligase RNF31-like isoform X2 [Protopterus annectens]
MLTSSPFKLPDEKYWIFRLLINIEERHFSLEEAAEAARSSIDFDSALRYLSHECPICNEQVSFNKIITMTHCSCAFCEKCFKAHFTTVIKEKSISHVVCPLCNNPDLKKDGNKEDVMEYFNLLDTQIRHYLDPEVHELFQSKLRDKTLMDMPNFRWCANCSFGLLHEASRLRMDCPSCGKSTCFQCRTPWEKQHEGISCEQFKTWKLQNHPEYQANRLARYLSMHGIECPSCGFQFDLSKGGCLHFICSQCQHEFCGGCKRPFKMDSACGFSRECHAKGLHAHHPRNCFYYLRDWDIKRLQQLLNHNRIPYRGSVREGSQMHAEGLCRVLEYKETIHGLTEEQCGQIAPAEYDGLCIKSLLK